jgi:hypothetical protein
MHAPISEIERPGSRAKGHSYGNLTWRTPESRRRILETTLTLFASFSLRVQCRGTCSAQQLNKDGENEK